MFAVFLVVFAANQVLSAPLESTVIAENGDIVRAATNDAKKTVANTQFENIEKQERIGRNVSLNERHGNNQEKKDFTEDRVTSDFDSGRLHVVHNGPDTRRDLYEQKSSADFSTIKENPINEEQKNIYSPVNFNVNNEHSHIQHSKTREAKEEENRKSSSINLNSDYNKPAAKGKPQVTEITSAIVATDQLNTGPTHQEKNRKHTNDPININIEDASRKAEQQVRANDNLKVFLNQDDSSSGSRATNRHSRPDSEDDGRIYFETMLPNRKAKPAPDNTSVMKISPSVPTPTPIPATTVPDFVDNRNAFDTAVTCGAGEVLVNNICTETAD